MPVYVGRFAPSPTGALHDGSLAAALASWLDARAHGGRWLVRIEDIDTPREVPGAARRIIEQLHAFGLAHDGDVQYQSRRAEGYREAFERLRANGDVYPCTCTRREIADSITRTGAERNRHDELVYPGTCRNGIAPGRAPRAWRVRVGNTVIDWCDRHAGPARESLADEVGDFVLLRADGLWAYQLAVVVDDAIEGVTDVVRGADLIHSSARQIHLQRLLGHSTPRYLHVPVVAAANGEKLSKQTGALEADTRDPVRALNRALHHLGLKTIEASNTQAFLSEAIERWRMSGWMADACAPDVPRPEDRAPRP